VFGYLDETHVLVFEIQNVIDSRQCSDNFYV